MAKKHKKRKKWISRLAILILFVVAGAVVYLVWDSYFRDKRVDSDGQDSGQTEIVDDNKDDEEDSKPVEKPKTIQYEGKDPNDLAELSGVITYAGVNGDYLVVRVNIDQYLGSGECGLEIVRDGSVLYSDMASVVQNVTTATCEGFDVPVSDLGGSGNIDIVITLNAEGKSGVIRGEASV